MSQVSKINQVVKDLWSGTVTGFEHNMLNHSIQLTVTVIDSAIENRYELMFLQVSKLEIFYENPENHWDYVELTEISIYRKNSYFEINCDFWSAGGMTLHCQKMIINGAELID